MAFGNLVVCVNRSTQPLEGTFDGQIIVFPPGYVDDGTGTIVRAVDGYGAPVVTMLPANVAAIVKSQNPVMGTQDVLSASPDDYLIGVEQWPAGRKDDTSHAEQSDKIEIIDRDSIADGSRREDFTVEKTRGGRKSRASIATKTRTPIKADYED